MRLRQPCAILGLVSAGMLGLTGCSGNALADACEDYYEFEQEHASDIQEATAVASGAQPDEEQLQQADEAMADAAEDYREMIDDADDEAFVAEAETAVLMFDVLETLIDQNVSDEQKMEAAESSDFSEAIEAENNLVRMCNEELS